MINNLHMKGQCMVKQCREFWRIGYLMVFGVVALAFLPSPSERRRIQSAVNTDCSLQRRNAFWCEEE